MRPLIFKGLTKDVNIMSLKSRNKFSNNRMSTHIGDNSSRDLEITKTLAHQRNKIKKLTWITLILLGCDF